MSEESHVKELRGIVSEACLKKQALEACAKCIANGAGGSGLVLCLFQTGFNMGAGQVYKGEGWEVDAITMWRDMMSHLDHSPEWREEWGVSFVWRPVGGVSEVRTLGDIHETVTQLILEPGVLEPGARVEGAVFSNSDGSTVTFHNITQVELDLLISQTGEQP